MPCWEIIASGRVQGVGMRWFILESAKRHGLRGFVRNLADGNVQIIAIGEYENVSSFAEEVRNGNSHSQIQHLSMNELTNYTEYKDFIIA